jgi:hypothetical protein
LGALAFAPDRVADSGGIGRARGPDPELAAPALCAICAREARGFGYCHHLRFADFPHHRFCSRRCQDLGAALATGNNGMIDKTAREAQAIKDARPSFAEALISLGLMAPFYHRTAAEIDQLIEAAVTGYIDSMLRQAARQERGGTTFDDPLPF